MTWRARAAPIIRRVILEVGVADGKALRKALRVAYPWSPRENHPYKIWLDEVTRQLKFHQVKASVKKDQRPAEAGQGALWT